MKILSDPLITIAIPTFNSSATISKTLDSVKNQSSILFECIIVDDGSDDDTLGICSEFCQMPNIRLASQKSLKKGANACRNIALQESSANHIMFLDADDYLDSRCVENRILEAAANPDFDFYIFPTAVIDQEGKITGKFYCESKDPEDIVCSFVRNRIFWQTVSPLWNKSFLKKIGGWNEDYLRLQDVELHIRAMLNNPKIHYADTKIDSFFHQSVITPQKTEDALWAFVRLLKEYYPIIKENKFLSIDSEKSENAFAGLISLTLNIYLTREKPDSLWEHEFLKSLETCNLDAADLKQIRSVLYY